MHSIVVHSHRKSGAMSAGGAQRGAWSNGGSEAGGGAALALYTSAGCTRPNGPSCASPRCSAYAGALVVGGDAGTGECVQRPMSFAGPEPTQIKLSSRPVWKQPSRKNIEG